MKPLIVGRRVFLEYLVRKEPKKVLTVVCKSVAVPRLFLPSDTFNLRPRLSCPANRADIVSVVFGKVFLGDGSLTALMVEPTRRHIDMVFFRHVILPQLVFHVVDDENPVLSTTMFDMPRKSHPSSSAGVMPLFDAQRDLRLQSLYPLLVLGSGSSCFHKPLSVTAVADDGDYSEDSSDQSKGYD